jgi:Zn-dependent protease with chaperone function
LDFFDAQDRARRATRRLVVAYVLASALIITGVTAVVGFTLFNFTDAGYGRPAGVFIQQQAPLLILTAIAAALLILGATAYKTAALSSGGGRVAMDMGGTLVPTDVRDPQRRQLRNVVEEMAIASGMPVPEIYVLESEHGINAFAAGFTTGDAAIAVTRGALELLDREELQGVIGHEFSHILNGDMRLNIRMMGVLFGIMVLALLGRVILRGGYQARLVSSRRGRGAPVVLMIGLGLAILGAIGVFIARIVKAAISRQRESLADASAVQFTRQTTGLANALKKIGGFSGGSYLQAADPEEVSHMLFGEGAKLSNLFATHPPLVERIRALDPSFDPKDYPVVDLRERPVATADAGPGPAAFAPMAAVAAGASLTHRVGRPATEHVDYAAKLRRSVPELLDDAAHSSELAYLLAIALVLDRDGRVLDRQLVLTEQRLGGQRTHLVRQYYDALAGTGAEYRLPLLQMAFAALKRRPAPHLAYLIDLARDLIEVDGNVDLYEFCFYRVLAANLGAAEDPAGRSRRRGAGKEAIRQAAVDLLSVIARHGSADAAARQRAFDAGIAVFGHWGSRYAFEPHDDDTVEVLDRSLDTLLSLNGDGKRKLLDAITAAVLADKRLSVVESELIRAVCASLDYPLPPILFEQPKN